MKHLIEDSLFIDRFPSPLPPFEVRSESQPFCSGHAPLWCHCWLLGDKRIDRQLPSPWDPNQVFLENTGPRKQPERQKVPSWRGIYEHNLDGWERYRYVLSPGSFSL